MNQADDCRTKNISERCFLTFCIVVAEQCPDSCPRSFKTSEFQDFKQVAERLCHSSLLCISNGGRWLWIAMSCQQSHMICMNLLSPGEGVRWLNYAGWRARDVRVDVTPAWWNQEGRRKGECE